MSRVLRQRRNGLAQIGIAVASIQLYEAVRRMLDPDWPAAIANARRIAALERWAHVAWEGSLQRAFVQAPEVVQAANLFYFVGHFLLTSLFFLWLYRRSRPAFGFYRNAFLAATALALLVHWRFPTAPPRLAGVGMLDTLRLFSGIDIGSAEGSVYYNPVAAVPSLHAAYAFGVGIGLVRCARTAWLRVAGPAYPALAVFTIVVTGNHFIFDAVAGVAVLGLGFAASALYCATRRGVEQSGSSPGS